MVCIYLCNACQDEDHAKCERGHSVPLGHYGGSACICGCKGNPKWNDPSTIHKEFQRHLAKLEKFEKESRKSMTKDKRRAKTS